MLAPDTVLQNRYLILRQLGQGGMGAVYQARDQRLGSVVILKKTLFSNAHLLKAFEGEACLLANLRHARLPLVMDYFIEGDGHFLVMQFIPGKDLEDLLKERREGELGPFTSDQALKWADQLLDALEYLHQHEPPIVHRDIKPQNVKRTPEGDVVLLDFGLAKGAAAGMAQANLSLHAFTRAYAPLEQIQGTGTDPRSDLYSLAATLYHLMTGETPPDAVTRAAAMVNGQPDPLRPADELNPQVPSAVAAVLHSALANNLNQRPASATAMRQALQAASRPPSDRQASTIVDLPPTNIVPSPSPSDEPIVSAQSSLSLPTKAQSAAASPLPPTILHAHTQSRDEVTPPAPPRSRKAMAIGLVLAAVMLVGAVLAFRSWHPKQVQDESHTTTASNSPAPATSPRIEVMHYYLELESSGGGTARATGNEPLTAGQAFKFHFIPRENGYLYVISLNDKNIPTTFLTAQQHPMWQMKTNSVQAGANFEFPGGEAKLGIAGETPFTIIFSPEPLTKPDFLAQRAMHVLTKPEQQELEALRQKFGASEVIPEVRDNQSIITVPAKRGFNGPLVFDIILKSR